MFKVMEREIDEMDETEKWKVADDEEEEDEGDSVGGGDWDASTPY
jgi:hypothetical protein